MLNAQEKYENLSVSVKDISEETKSIKSITIDGHKFENTFFMGADMKYLAICAGIQSANATFSCIRCKCPAENRHDTSQSWCTVPEQSKKSIHVENACKCNNIIFTSTDLKISFCLVNQQPFSFLVQFSPC